jgi:hypothetical protein
MMEKRIFERIYKSIPKGIFINEDGILSASVDIYLTWCGIRPACIPFDGEVKYNGLSSNEMFSRMTTSQDGKKCLQLLNRIPKLKVVIGPYYDTGLSIVVSFNRLRFYKILGFGYADSGENLKVSTCIASLSLRCLNTYRRLRDIIPRIQEQKPF